MIFRSLKSSFKKVQKALSKTRSFFVDRLTSILKKPLNEETLDQLEQALYESDLGVETVADLVAIVQKHHKKNPGANCEDYLNLIRNEILTHFKQSDSKSIEKHLQQSPTVTLIVGVNGTGKTTACAKLANHFIQNKQSVLLAACDTYRAAATEQLEIWSNRLGISLVKGLPNSDPAAVAYDAVTSAVAKKIDRLIIDTAGRLQNRQDLLRELEKIRKSCDKVYPGSPHETFLVLDATIGQNAIDQAEIFHKYTPLSGLILTKLDGTSKGGIVVNIHRKLNIPVKWIGVGEGLDDLEVFDPQVFVDSLFADSTH